MAKKKESGFYAYAYKNDDGTYYAPLIHRCETQDDVEWLKDMHQKAIDACKKELSETKNEKKQAVVKLQLDLLDTQVLVSMDNYPQFTLYSSDGV